MPSKDYYASDKDKYRKKSLDYYLKNREERDRINKLWVKNNPAESKSIKDRYREKNKEELKRSNQKYNQAHKVERQEYRKAWRKNNPEKDMNGRLILNYGITYEEYVKILQGQNNKCGVCGVEFKSIYKFPDLRSSCVDHSHLNRKEIRGILCRGCNSGIGFFDDSPVLLESALQWLTRKEYDIIFEKNWYQKKIKESLYRLISEDQNNKCGICQKELASCTRINLDHNHISMKVRGLLCAKCNKALGFLMDDSIRIKNALNWLK